jgi:K+-sensing histidine kinase KdpD
MRAELDVSKADRAARLDVIEKLHAYQAELHAEQAKLHAELAARLDLIRELDAYVAILKRQLREHEKLSSRFRLYPAAFVILFAAIMVLRNSVDAPPFNVLNTIIEACVLSAAMKWGGMTAAITSLLFVIGVDFFLVDPVLALGVNDWRELIELTFASAFALGLGVTASRIFPSLLAILRRPEAWAIRDSPVGEFAFAYPVTPAIALLSCRYFEAPILKLRTRFG